jgi:hypothetical protein
MNSQDCHGGIVVVSGQRRRRNGLVALLLMGVIVLSGCQIVTSVGGPGVGSGLSVSMNTVGVGIGSSGSVLVADPTHGVVRKVNSSGSASIVAGVGTQGFAGDGSTATAAELGYPTSAIADGSGNVIIADTTNQRLRVVAGSTGSYYGISMTGGDIYTVAGNGTFGHSGDGGSATSAELAYPTGVVPYIFGSLMFADGGTNVVRLTAGASGAAFGQSMTSGDIYTIAGNGGIGYSGDGAVGTSALLNNPSSVTFDSHFNAVIADTGNNVIRVIAASTGTFYGISMIDGDIYTIGGNGTSGHSGDGGAATSAEMTGPADDVTDGSGDIVFGDTGNSVVRVIAESTGSHYGQSMTAGDIYTIGGNGTSGYSGDGGAATSAELSGAGSVAVDGSGDVVIGDAGNNRLRVIASTTGTHYGVSMTAGDIYTIAGNGRPSDSGDGGVAGSAELNYPTGIALDGASNLVIADASNNRVRVVAKTTGTSYGVSTTAGDIYTIAGNGTAGYSGDSGAATSGELSYPETAVLDGSGNVVIADTNNNRVRVVAKTTGSSYGVSMTAGDIYTIAGNGTAGYSGDSGAATSGELSGPSAVLIDSAGNVLIADTTNNRVRVVAKTTGTSYGVSMTAGDIYTIAGNGTAGYSGDGAGAPSAEMDSPTGIAVDSAGNVLVADASNNRVRVVAKTTGTSYGVSMTAGDIYTIAGNGTAGYSGDSGASTSAELNGPTDIVVDSSGNVVISDTGNDRIRAVAAATGTFEGMATTSHDIYTLAGSGTEGFSGDSGYWTLAELDQPTGLSLDGSGDLYIADSGNDRIRELNP